MSVHRRAVVTDVFQQCHHRQTTCVKASDEHLEYLLTHCKSVSLNKWQIIVFVLNLGLLLTHYCFVTYCLVKSYCGEVYKFQYKNSSLHTVAKCQI